MGSPTIYWYPPGSSRLRVITLPYVSGVAWEEDRDVIVTQSVSGQSRRLDFGGRRRVRISIGQVASEATARELDALIVHAKRGGTFGFSVDHAKTWASTTLRAISAGDTAIPHRGNAFAVWSSAGALATGDIVRIEGPPPTDRPELCAVSTVGGLIHTLSEAVRGTPDGSPVIVRWRDFYPVLYLSPDAPEPMTSDGDRRMFHRLTLECFEPAGDLATAVTNAARLGGTSAPYGAGTEAMRLGMLELLASGAFDDPGSIQKPIESRLTNFFAPRRS